MKTAILVVLAVFMSGAAGAEELRAPLRCQNGKCELVQTGGAADSDKVGGLLKKAEKLRQRYESLVEQGSGKAGDVQTDVTDLKKDMRLTEKALQQVERDAKAGKADGALALKNLAAAKKQLESAGEELLEHRHALRELMKSVWRLKNRHINLELAVFGGFAYKYGGTVGALVSLALPMGERGLWTTRLSGGLGVSPSFGFGWLAMGSVAQRLGSRWSLGPAVLAMGDAGNLLQSKNWLVGGGAEVRYGTERAYLVVTPFIGATVKSQFSGVGWQDAVFKDTSCGPILVKEAGWSEYEDARHLKFTAGALVSVSFPLFQ